MKQATHDTFPEPLQRLIEARHHDPFEVLGCHTEGNQSLVRVLLPRAKSVILLETSQVLQRIEGTDIFEGRFTDPIPDCYQLAWEDEFGQRHQHYDPYCFPPQLAEFDLHLFGEGRHRHAYRFLGAHPHQVDGIAGMLFAVWAPNAARVSVVGDFNQWDGRVHPLRVRGGCGIWELFIPGLQLGAIYKFEIRSNAGDTSLRTDPYGNHFQLRPETAGIAIAGDRFTWDDAEWLSTREQTNWQQAPMSTYEVHLGSWQRDEEGNFLNYRELAHRLCEHAKSTGFTHIELLPITE
ncbi:MAG: 1,4-alpha-glucan branching enzyme, partial [Pseudomonadota bacterium]